MRIVVTGATGSVGRQIVATARARGDQVRILTRDRQRASATLGVESCAWDPISAPPPVAALSDADAVIHLAGEPVSQRWHKDVRQKIRESREIGTRNLVKALASVPADRRPRALISASASGYYGDRGDELLTEDSGPGSDFLADVCRRWEHEATLASRHGVRVVTVRTGNVLTTAGGMLPTMLRPFQLGLGGPIAGGRQYMSLIHIDDLVALYLRAASDKDWSGAYNATLPEPISGKAFTRALGQVLRRPALMPIPLAAIKLLFGEMATIIASSQRALPTRPLAHRFTFAHANIDEALRSLLGR